MPRFAAPFTKERSPDGGGRRAASQSDYSAPEQSNIFTPEDQTSSAERCNSGLDSVSRAKNKHGKSPGNISGKAEGTSYFAKSTTLLRIWNTRSCYQDATRSSPARVNPIFVWCEKTLWCYIPLGLYNRSLEFSYFRPPRDMSTLLLKMWRECKTRWYNFLHLGFIMTARNFEANSPTRRWRRYSMRDHVRLWGTR